MAFRPKKVDYVDYETVIHADNMNDIQDAIIDSEDDIIRYTSYVVCETQANVTTKTAPLAGFTLEIGATVRVKFTNTNTAENPTLNVNDTGAKPIYTNTGEAVGTTPDTAWAAGEIVELVYDGTNWVRPAGAMGSVGSLADLETTDKSTIVAAINEVNGIATGNVSDISDLNDEIGDLTDLDTTDKSDVVSAINEVVGNQGDITGLDTTDKSDIVSAVNEVLDDVKQGFANNLIPYPYYRADTYTHNGITYTVNDDLSVTANGTATATSAYNFRGRTETTNTLYLAEGSYTLSGCPSGGGSSTYRLRVNETYNGAARAVAADSGNGATFTVDAEQAVYPKGVYIEIYTGTTVNNLVFKPMLEKGTVAHDYVPYNDSIGGVRRDIGDLADLETTATSDLVSAINEVNSETDIIDKLGAVIVTTPEFSTLPQTFTDAQLTFERGNHITTDLICGMCDFKLSNNNAMFAPWTINTEVAGQITISGHITGATTLKIYFRHQDVAPPEGGVSSEYIGVHSVIKVELTDITSLPVTFTGLTGVTAQHEALVDNYGVITPKSSANGDWSFTCGTESVTISGTFNGSTATTVKLTLCIPDNKITASATGGE